VPRNARQQIEVLAKAEGALEASVLFALGRLGVFRALAGEDRSASEIAGEVDCNADRLERLLRAGVAIGALTDHGGGRYGARPAYQAVLGDPEADTFLGDWLAFLSRLTPRMLELAEVVRSGAPRSAWPVDDEDGAVMARAMHAYARARGLEIADRIDLSSARTVVDLGCGSGAYGIALAERAPHVSLTLVDLPEVVPTVRATVARHPSIAGRVEVVGADIFDFEPPEPADVVLVSNTLHMLGPELSASLIARTRRLLVPGGRLVIQAQFLDAGRLGPRWSVLLDVIQLAITTSGANHSVAETVSWLEHAGFGSISYIDTPLWNVCNALVAVNPG